MHSVVKTWLAFGLAFFLTGCGQETVQSKPEIHITGSTMGTYYSIKVADSAVQDAARLQAEVDVLLERVNDQMSTYRPDSELSRFNQHKSNTPVVVSRDTARVVTEAIHIGRESRGALDVTVGPLVNLWGFGPDARPTKVPSDELIAQTRQKTGLGNLHVITSADADTLQKDIPDLYVDLSAIAKGFGAWTRWPSTWSPRGHATIWLRSAASCASTVSTARGIPGVSPSRSRPSMPVQYRR
jgi:thiamine biosynthesis lipoprotein